MAPIIGGAVGAVCFVIALIGIAVVCHKRKKKNSPGVSVRVERARARVRTVIRVHVSAYHETCNDLCEKVHRSIVHTCFCVYIHRSAKLFLDTPDHICVYLCSVIRTHTADSRCPHIPASRDVENTFYFYREHML